MEREQILRDDFPSARKGWDPDAVREHLRAVADSAAAPAGGGTALADDAAERVRTVIAAAERLAEEMSTEARSDADRLIADAKREAEQIVARAREEAEARVEQARAAVGGLVAQADELRSKVGTLGEELSGTIRSSTASIGNSDARAEVPGPVVVPEPTPPTIPEPTPDPVPEPTPDPVPDPTPDPVPEPTPDPAPEPDLPDEPDVTPPAPEPDVTPPPAAGEASNEDLIAQLRGGDANGSVTNGAVSAPAATSSEEAAARLVAMNMALDGSTREEIAAKLSSEFGDDADLEGVLDDVLARAAR